MNVFPLLPIAAFADDFLPVIAMVLIFGIPIIAILTAHQRKMAELFRGQNAPQQLDSNLQYKLDSLQSQVSELKQLMQEHIINSDAPAISAKTPPQVPTIEQRLNS